MGFIIDLKNGVYTNFLINLRIVNKFTQNMTIEKYLKLLYPYIN